MAEFEPNVRSDRFYIAISLQNCWKCHKDTKVYAFMLPAGHEQLEYDEDLDKETWTKMDFSTTISGIDGLNENALKAIKSLTNRFFLDYSKTTSDHYYMNHCEYCKAKQGDFFLHDEVDGAFFFMTEDDAKKVKLHKFKEPFEASCTSFSMGIEFLDIA